MHLKTLGQKCGKQGSRSSATFFTRADMKNVSGRSSATSFAWAVYKHWKSTGYVIFTLDGCSTIARAWDSGSHSSATLVARAVCKTCELLVACISRLSRLLVARAKVQHHKVVARAQNLLLKRRGRIWNFQIALLSAKLNFKAANHGLLGQKLGKTYINLENIVK